MNAYSCSISTFEKSGAKSSEGATEKTFIDSLAVATLFAPLFLKVDKVDKVEKKDINKVYYIFS